MNNSDISSQQVSSLPYTLSSYNHHQYQTSAHHPRPGPFLDFQESANLSRPVVHGCPSLPEPFRAEEDFSLPYLPLADSVTSTLSSQWRAEPGRHRSAEFEAQNATFQNSSQSTQKVDEKILPNDDKHILLPQPQISVPRQRTTRAKSRTKTRLSDYHNYYAKYNQLADRGLVPSAILQRLGLAPEPPTLGSMKQKWAARYRADLALRETSVPATQHRLVPALNCNGDNQRTVFAYHCPRPTYYGAYDPTKQEWPPGTEPKHDYFKKFRGNPPLLDQNEDEEVYLCSYLWNKSYNAMTSQFQKWLRNYQECHPYEVKVLQLEDHRSGLIRWATIKQLIKDEILPVNYVDDPEYH